MTFNEVDTRIFINTGTLYLPRPDGLILPGVSGENY
jgi:hypothetical protein